MNAVAVFPDQRTIISTGRDGLVNLWDVASGDLITTLYGHRHQVFCVAVSPDGKTLASGGLDGDIGLWRTSAP